MNRADVTLERLLAIARAQFPEYFSGDSRTKLLSFMSGGLSGTFPGTLIEIPLDLKAAFLDAARADPSLSGLASEPYYTTDLGSRGRVGFGRLPEALLFSAASRLVLMDVELTEDAFLGEVASDLTAFRRLVAGEEEACVQAVGVRGIEVPSGLRIDLPWGELRTANDHERRIPGGADLRVDPFGADGATAVLIWRSPIRMHLHDAEPDPSSDGIYTNEARHDVDKRARQLSLASLIGIPRDASFVAPRMIWSTYAYAGSGMGAFGLGRWQRGAPTRGSETLTDDEIGALRATSQIVHERWDPAIEVAVDRTISALAERGDPADALIDAVIAWESLIGAETEVTFQITAGLAHLLERDPTRREDLRRELRAVYSVRSKLVHGAEPDGLEEAATRAIATSATALRVLFTEIPDLIPAENRGARLLLGDYERIP